MWTKKAGARSPGKGYTKYKYTTQIVAPLLGFSLGAFRTRQSRAGDRALDLSDLRAVARAIRDHELLEIYRETRSGRDPSLRTFSGLSLRDRLVRVGQALAENPDHVVAQDLIPLDNPEPTG